MNTAKLSDKVPPTMRKRMDSLGIKSIRELERKMDVSNAAVNEYLSTNKSSVIMMLSLLRTLGYQCNAPEFDLIKEICFPKELKPVGDSPTIPSVKSETKPHVLQKRKVQVLFQRSTDSLSAA